MLLMEVGGGLSPFEMCEGDACHDLAVRPAPWVGEFSVRMSALYSDSADTCKERITVLIQAYSLALFDVRSDLGLH